MLMAATIVAFKQHPRQGLVAMAQPKLRVLLPRSSVVAGEAVWTGVCAGRLAIAFTVQPKKICDGRHYASFLPGALQLR